VVDFSYINFFPPLAGNFPYINARFAVLFTYFLGWLPPSARKYQLMY